MTCLELSTSKRHGFNPIVVLKNKGDTERFIQKGPFNDIPNWEYHEMPDLLGEAGASRRLQKEISIKH